MLNMVDMNWEVMIWALSRQNLSWSFWQKEIKTSLLSYRDWQKNWNFVPSRSRYDTVQYMNNKGADQTVRMRRLVCTFVVRKPPKIGFLVLRPISWRL